MSLRNQLRNGDLLLSTMVGEMKSPSLPHLLAVGGLDSFIIDMEHGTHDWGDMAALITVGKAIGLHPVVRIPEVRRETVLKPFDAGAAGILVPMVNTADAAAEIVQWAKYPPLGVRGVSLRRGHNDFRPGPMVPQLENANANNAVIIQIESGQAVDNIDDLVAVDGVDAVFIGPNDLSVALGVPGELDSPVMTEAIDRVLAACRDTDVAVGFQAFSVPEAQGLVERGVRYLSYSTDTNAITDKAAEISSGLRTAVQGG